MSLVYLLNKPFQVLSQFTDSQNRKTLKEYIDTLGIHPAGRLDYDSEGLLLLTDDGRLQARIADPEFKLEKAYWVQVEGEINEPALLKLQNGVRLKDGLTKPAKAKRISAPAVWERVPAIRERKSIPTSWLELRIKEGKNRQVRRMTAEVGFPTLRLIRFSIGHWTLENLQPGEFRTEHVHLPNQKPDRKKHYQRKNKR